MGKPEHQHNLQISEIFKSIQGEGQLQGELTTFIRTSGCNLRCAWCDTAYAQDGGRAMTVPEILRMVEDLSCGNVCVTGGEPLIQPGMRELLRCLKAMGCYVLVETNGTQNISGIGGVDRFVVDYKLPSAVPRQPFFDGNWAALGTNDELKFVVKDRFDYLRAREIIGANGTRARVVFSPGEGTERQLADWMIRDNLPARYSLQIHKVIWGDKRGV